MLKKGLVLGVVMYNALIDRYCKVGRTINALEVLGVMKSNNCIPNARTYNEKDLKANEVIYTALINGYYKVGKVGEAHSLFKRMLSEECLANSITLNVLIDYLHSKKKV